MAVLAPWLAATIAFLPAIAVAVYACGVGGIHDRLAAAQFAGGLGASVLVTMSVAFDQASSIDLALMLCLLTLPASLLFALFVERWL
jgi:multisubunit Na+/H+ antiporter MnhF subunit